MPSADPQREYRISCAPGLSTWLGSEIESLGLSVESTDHTGVFTRATMADAMRMLLWLRTGFHVLQRFADIRATDADMLYAETTRLPWERVIPPDGTITVVSAVDNPTITNSMFPNVKIKDAIVDRLMKVNGRRPNAGSKGDQTVIHLFWKKDKARLSLDLAGPKLSDRGYRREPGKAPLRETTAAAILLAAGHDGIRPLVIPMCGSGTLAIEAALISANRAPGLLRSGYGIQHLQTFDQEQWRQARADAKRASGNAIQAPIIATDIDAAVVEAARRNARTAGVDHLIEFSCCDFADTPMPEEPGVVILHGEYGLRLGDEHALAGTYRRMGDFLKQRCAGWDGFVFTAKEHAGRIGLKAASRIPFEHAGIDCRLLRYELYAGSTPA
ncbi:MAG: RNA methyltransferase [Phycisphaerae bacterium]|nr:RNA methyltransferase [Phycisphaerae bacterium]